MSTLSDRTTDPADSFFEPRDAAWFRARLTLRLAVPLDRHAQLAALKVAGSTALAAPPITIALIAPAAKLTPSTVLGLFCAALPGFAATAWTAAGLRDTRQLALRGLRQAGAEQRLAWLIAAARLSLFAGIGASTGCTFLALSHAPLGTVLPQHSPLRGMFAADTPSWLIGVALTVMLTIGGALLASSPVWTSTDWGRFAVWRRITVPAAAALSDPRLRRGFARLKLPKTPNLPRAWPLILRRIRVPRGSRQPR